MPERRPSPVRAWTCPQIWKRSRMRRADLVEDFGQVAAGLALQDDGRDEELQVEVGDPVGHAVERLLQGDAQVLLLEDAAELLAHRRAHLRRRSTLNPEARLCPARSERASMSRASGSWTAKAFRRRRRRHKSQSDGQAAP